ncbi:hypothetical protein Tco_0264351 [Tanacetum coccineum]
MSSRMVCNCPLRRVVHTVLRAVTGLTRAFACLSITAPKSASTTQEWQLVGKKPPVPHYSPPGSSNSGSKPLSHACISSGNSGSSQLCWHACMVYALTHNPTIYDSLVKQFWQTATVRTLANGTQQLVASIDSKEYTITEAFCATMDQGDESAQPAEPHHTPVDPLPSTSLPPIPSPPLQSPPHSPLQSPPHSPLQSPPHSPRTPLPKGNTSGSVEASIQLKELMVLVPNLVTRVTSLEKELKETKQTLGNVVLKLSTDKGKRYRRIARSMAKNINTGLDAKDEINTGRVEINTGIEDVNTGRVEKNSGIEDVNTGSTKVDTGRTSISTSSIILSPKKGQREGKAQMVEEDIQATHKTKEQIRQEEAGLEEAIDLPSQMDEEVAKQIHLDKMVAKRVQEEQELSEQQLKRKAEVQEAAQFYTEEDWDTIRAKLEANTEVVKSLQGESISNDDFAKRMVEMINEKKKFYAEQKAKAKRSKPMTQAQQREYMSTFIKNQSSWKLSQLKKLSFEELKTEFEKLMKSIESFVPMETEARVKRHGLQLEQETSKKQKIDIEDASITKGKDEVVKEEEAEVPVKKTGKRRKQKARKGINIAKTAQDEFNNEREAFVKDKVKDASSESEICQKAAYQIIRRDGSDKIYMSFGAILKDFSRDDLIELYRLVIKKYGENRPEEMYDRVLWGDLKTMFDPPLSDDAIWSLPLQQKIINWRYYPTCAVHCLTLDASTIYMLADRKYPLSKDACQVMLKMKLLDGKAGY